MRTDSPAAVVTAVEEPLITPSEHGRPHKSEKRVTWKELRGLSQELVEQEYKDDEQRARFGKLKI